MGSHRASVRYAKSVIELAQAQKSLEKVKEDMLLFTQVINENRELEVVLKNPIVPADKKKAILKALFEKRIQPLTYKAFVLIVSKNRESILDEIAIEFVNQYNVLKGIAVATVTTPYTLGDSQRKDITKIVADITGMKVELTEVIDESLIGGFVLNIGDKQIDESVKSKLANIQRALVA
ncbi:MAG: ATP synthase F1 subunit delta [Cyclobacteriaceae bacterium]|nr:ATP synthase F1 subunit delta [Cyclobacteriaceae bacterium]